MVAIVVNGDPQAVAKAVSAIDEVDYVVIVAGRYDILVELVCRDTIHLLDLVTRLRKVKGVSSTELFTYLSLEKQTYAWGAV
jgi:Lrp/AsnC family transcriptional regulator for asnA, asnC and gidA